MRGKLRLYRFGAFVVVMVAPFQALGDLNPIVNGDFSAGLTGWDVTGNVSVVGGAAFLEEVSAGPGTTLGQWFTLPAAPLELSFRLDFDQAAGGPTDPGAFPDVFQALLLLPTIEPDLEPFLAADVAGFDPSGLTTVGAEDPFGFRPVMVDLSSFAALPGGTNLLISFGLFGASDGTITQVRIDDVAMRVVPAPGAIALALIGFGSLGVWRRLIGHGSGLRGSEAA